MRGTLWRNSTQEEGCTGHSFILAFNPAVLCCVQIAWRLHRMALNAAHDAFAGFAIDGKLKKIAQTANLWSLMRGSAADTDTPTVTLDFDFVWQVCAGI
jgi:glutathionylspermidine synthase